MKKDISYLKIGQKGVINFDIPVYTIGEGKPTLTITCSVHGDETAGLFIVSGFLELIKDIKLNGTINIIPSANPVAQFLNNRVAFLDHKDLNRLNYGNKSGSYTERVVAELFEFMNNSDVVINIHEFEMKTPVTGIFDNFGDEEIKNKNLRIVEVFNPEIIWQINYDQHVDEQYQTTLDMALTNANIVNFAFETSKLALITDDEIKRASHGLFNVACELGIISEKIEHKKCVKLVRKEFKSDIAGLWEPDKNLKLKQNIKKGDLIGKVSSLPDFEITEIYSHYDGLLMQYRHRQMIGSSSAIFSIGIPQ